MFNSTDRLLFPWFALWRVTQGSHSSGVQMGLGVLAVGQGWC